MLEINAYQIKKDIGDESIDYDEQTVLRVAVTCMLDISAYQKVRKDTDGEDSHVDERTVPREAMIVC
jgi:endonuclease/exonuclease/phosphatase family metal-dependent hydrolase